MIWALQRGAEKDAKLRPPQEWRPASEQKEEEEAGRACKGARASE
jgi:hypothetical protein